MVQGCTSDAGKTVMVAGLCRLLARRGIRVAPFKPQNMALNSAVTPCGGEIGRAQALQAVAAGVDARVDFNPILLKPSSDTGAQVIVHGKALTNMQAQAYHDYKTTAMRAVLASHENLARDFAAIVVEGAGSPAEINLRKGDIANMGFAEAVDCPVILVADIDRGGVFAHLVGTLELLSEREQNRVVGFILNRFRGDISLLQSGLDWLEQRTGKPVLGVVPYLSSFYLDAEDAISTEQQLSSNPQNEKLNVVVPVLPRISNHTDFDGLRLHPDVNLRFVDIQETDRSADLIVLPGSKNVIHDLAKLKRYGWHQTLLRHCRYGGKVLGVCGGYQMLGHTLTDPTGIENNSESQHATGFGLLDIDTELAPEKQLKNVSARLSHPAMGDCEVHGYEIHCGHSRLRSSATTLLTLVDGNRQDGCVSADANIAGTYIHGLFDRRRASQTLLAWAGLNSTATVDLNQIREQQLDRLADCLESHLDTDFLAAFAGQVDNRKTQAC